MLMNLAGSSRIELLMPKKSRRRFARKLHCWNRLQKSVDRRVAAVLRDAVMLPRRNNNNNNNPDDSDLMIIRIRRRALGAGSCFLARKTAKKAPSNG